MVIASLLPVSMPGAMLKPSDFNFDLPDRGIRSGGYGAAIVARA
jgi:hypothetical protein